MILLWFLIAGVVSGIIAGMGMGGGTLLIPILTIFLDVEQRLAQGVNLIVFVPMSIVVLIIHCKNKLVDFKVGIPIILSGLVASICGSLLAMRIDNIILQKLFGVFLLVIGVWQIIGIFYSKKSKIKSQIKFVSIFKYR